MMTYRLYFLIQFLGFMAFMMAEHLPLLPRTYWAVLGVLWMAGFFWFNKEQVMWWSLDEEDRQRIKQGAGLDIGEPPEENWNEATRRYF